MMKPIKAADASLSPKIVSRHTAPATLAVFLALAFVTLVTAAQVVPFIDPQRPEPLTWRQATIISGSRWLFWIIPTPFIVELGLRFDFRRGRRMASLPVHAVLWAGASVLVWVCINQSIQLAGNETVGLSFATLMSRVLTGTQPQTSALMYLLIIGLGAGVRAWQESRDAAVAVARSEALVARARLETLAARLQPHFLFNTLHMVGALIYTQPDEARAVLSELGDLLREALSDSERGEVTVQEELQLAQRYLAIVGRRLGDRMQCETTVAPDCLSELVPRFVLQPLLENAIQHGISPTAEGGSLRLSITRDRSSMRVSIWNSGRLADGNRAGLGLNATRERLTMWRSGSECELKNADGGVEAVIRIPLPQAS